MLIKPSNRNNEQYSPPATEESKAIVLHFRMSGSTSYREEMGNSSAFGLLGKEMLNQRKCVQWTVPLIFKFLQQKQFLRDIERSGNLALLGQKRFNGISSYPVLRVDKLQAFPHPIRPSDLSADFSLWQCRLSQITEL